MSNQHLDCCDEKVQHLRTMGWAHALDLIALGLEQDASTCDGEGWPRTSAALARWAERIGQTADVLRGDIRRAERCDMDGGSE